MKKNLQEAEYKEITGLDIKGQLLENAGTPEDRGDGKPFLMHKLKVMIGPYQKDIPITNQELRKIMFIQENKKMTLKERIEKELIKVLQEGGAEMMAQYQMDAEAGKQSTRPKVLADLYKEFVDKDLKSAMVELGIDESKITALYQALTDAMGLQQGGTPVSIKEMIKEELENAIAIGEINMPFKVAMEIKNLDDNISRLMAQRDSIAREHGEQPRYAKMVRDAGGLTREGEGGGRHKAKQMYRLGYEDGLRGQLPNNLKLRDNEHYKAGNKEGGKERAAGRGYGD